MKIIDEDDRNIRSVDVNRVAIWGNQCGELIRQQISDSFLAIRDFQCRTYWSNGIQMYGCVPASEISEDQLCTWIFF